MPFSRRSAVGLVVCNALAATFNVHGEAQQTLPDLSRSRPGVSGSQTREPEDPSATVMRERMHETALKAANEDRRKRMLADTEKLLALSAELKADIEKSNKDELSMQVIRKAAEIEKLAHDVQQRMKN